MEDKYSIRGFKSWAVVKGIDYLQKKIKIKDLDEMIDKIDDTFPNKHSLAVMKDTRTLVGRFFMRLSLRIGGIEDGRVKPRYEEKKTRVVRENKQKKRRKGRR